MKEYGVKESLTKLLTIPYTGETLGHHYTPICVFANGDILLGFGMHLVLYNSDDGLKDFEITNLSGSLEVNTYIKSLISPKV